MNDITFHPLSEIPAPELVALLTDPDVRRHMPLAGDHWDEASATDWARAKDAQWQENGYGPWAIRIDGSFAGWGGYQKEGDEADLGLVLLPGQWGHGAAIFRELVRRGTQMQIRNVEAFRARGPGRGRRRRRPPAGLDQPLRATGDRP